MDPLQAEYEEALNHCDREAVRAKKRHQRIWCISTVTTWLTLIACIIGLWKPVWLNVSEGNWQQFERLFLTFGVPISSAIVSLATIAQMAFNHRKRWRNYRRCAEELCSHCVLYRRKLAL
jgi:hypothetical protein